MLSIRKRTLRMELESLEIIDGQFDIKSGIISFYTGDDDDAAYFNEWRNIVFEFHGYKLRIPKEPEGIRRITNLCVNLTDRIIFTIDNDTNERIELGTMPEFKTPEDAIGILEQFIEDLKEKYKDSV